MIALATICALGATPGFGWSPDAGVDTVASRFPAPDGTARVPQSDDTFGAWLRTLPLLPEQTPVRLHSGRLKGNQGVHAAVIDIDVGPRDLQQCADAVMRLRAEWLWAAGRAEAVTFDDTGRGAPMPFSRWAKGERPRARGNTLLWTKTAAPDGSRAAFRAYLDSVFTWAGTASLERQLVSVPHSQVQPGDVLIKGGFPGHAVLVLDVARSVDGARLRVLLAQSFMPAQNLHVLRGREGAWFEVPADEAPWPTPEWDFPARALKRWEPPR